VQVVSPPSGIVTLSGFDPALVRAVFNPIERTIDLVGLRNGTTTVTVSDQYGLSATLTVVVAAYAGKAYNSTELVITGDPAAADFVAEEAVKAAKLVAYPESGARVSADTTDVRGAHELRGDDAQTVFVPLAITGTGYVPYHQTVAVHVTNLAQPNIPPKNLLVSDFPETIVENGTLFYADVNFDDPARLLYYHYAAPQSVARRVLVKAQNNSPFTSLLQLISGIAGPDPNILAVGHDSTKHFLMHEAAGEGEIFSVPASATVNDVIVSAVAGGLGEYLRAAGVQTLGLRIRAMVPVNMRPPSDTGMTGNRFSLVYVELPVGVPGAWERLMRVKIEMDRIKGSLEPIVGWLLVQGLGLLPAELERLASSFYAGKASLVLSNVIGPPRRIFVAGAPVRQMTFWEPESGGLGIGISIYSYAGEITVGVVSDRNLVAEPGQITAAVMRAFADLSTEAS